MRVLIISVFISALIYAVNTSERVYYEGVNLFNDLKYEEAILRFKRAYRLNSRNKDALYRLAVSYAKIGLHKEAVDTFLKLKGSKEYTFLSFELGKSYSALKRFREAHRAFDASIRSGIYVDKSYFLKGYIDVFSGEEDRGVSYFARIKDDSDVYQAAQYYSGVASFNLKIKEWTKSEVKDENFFRESKIYFKNVLEIDDENALGEKAEKYLHNIKRMESPFKVKDWDLAASIGHEYDTNILNVNNIDDPQATKKSAHMGSLGFVSGYKLYEKGHWYAKASGIAGFNRYYSSDADIYSNNSATVILGVNSTYKNTAYEKNYKIDLDYAFIYSLTDHDRNKKLGFSSYTHSITPGVRYQFIGSNHTMFKIPVSVTLNTSQNDSSDSMSTGLSVTQDYAYKKFSNMLTIGYEMYDSKTNTYDKKIIRGTYRISHPVKYEIIPSLNISYSKSSYDTSSQEDDTNLKASLSASKFIKKFNVTAKYSIEKQGGENKYSKHKLGIDASYTF